MKMLQSNDFIFSDAHIFLREKVSIIGHGPGPKYLLNTTEN